MLDTVLAQLGLAASLLFGRPLSAWSLNGIISGLQAARAEFGTIQPAGASPLGVVDLDDEARETIQLRRFRSQARRAAGGTRYYEQLVHDCGLDLQRLQRTEIARLPITPKVALRDDPDAFVCQASDPCFRTTTTGTTGRPTSLSFSQAELHTYIALIAINFLAHGQVQADDIVQLSTSARATLGNTCFAGACARIGAQVSLAGLVDPAQALSLLAEERQLTGKKRRTSILSTYPSYLGALVDGGLRLGYSPADFGLQRVALGGELVTAGLKMRCQQLFGPLRFDESYAAAETWPMGGIPCGEGHLHFEPTQGLVEIVSLDGSTLATAGELGTIVATPFPPFRETTLLLRYDTEDVVQTLAGPLTCSLRSLPATSPLLGKRGQGVQHARGWTFPRQVLEALESMDAVPLPARYGFWATADGVAVEVVTETSTAAVRQQLGERLEAQGVPLRALQLYDDLGQLTQPRPVRADLREALFTTASALAGVGANAG